VCAGCGHAFPVEEGIPRLYWPHEGLASDADVTERVKDFYEEHPFPDYEEHDSVRSLIEKSRRSGYARELERAIPLGGKVLEVGCGTGQLSNFLGISCRRVVGTDLCLNSLRLGEGFRSAHGLDRTVFLQMNLFRPAFRPGSFDVLLCNGVLHHTSDPFGGLAGLVPLVRPGGHVVIGLYNRFGRAMTDLRRQLFRLTGGRGRWIDPHLRSGLGAAKQRAWFADQYRHPHESEHSIGEVQGWFERCGLDFVRGVPPVVLGDDPAPEEGLFQPARPGTRLDHLLAQLSWVVSGNREGGFFVLIGRRRGAAGRTAPATGHRIE
jgi:SAM-dependent methyltransferase